MPVMYVFCKCIDGVWSGDVERVVCNLDWATVTGERARTLQLGIGVQGFHGGGAAGGVAGRQVYDKVGGIGREVGRRIVESELTDCLTQRKPLLVGREKEWSGLERKRGQTDGETDATIGACDDGDSLRRRHGVCEVVKDVNVVFCVYKSMVFV